MTASLFVVPSQAGAAPPTSINRTNSQIDSLQARAQTLAQRITNDQTKVSVAAEQYDEETILLQKDQATLAKTVKELTATRRQLGAAKVRVRTAAIDAYVTGDGLASQVGAVLNSTVNDAESAVVYSNVVTLRSSRAIQLHVVTARLACRALHPAEDPAAAAQAQRAAGKARAAAQAATLNAESALHEVKGQLYQLTLKREQEIAAAAAAAAAARAAAARAAAAQGCCRGRSRSGRRGRSGRRRGRGRCRQPPQSERQPGQRQGNGGLAPMGRGRGATSPGTVKPLVPVGTNSSGPGGGHRGRVLPRRSLRVGRRQPTGRRLLGPHHVGVGSGRRRSAAWGNGQDEESTRITSDEHRTRRPALLPLRQRRPVADHARRHLRRLGALRHPDDHPGGMVGTNVTYSRCTGRDSSTPASPDTPAGPDSPP